MSRHTPAALVAAVALGVATAALAADGDSSKATGARAARASAVAYQRADSDGNQKGQVTSVGNDSNRGIGTKVTTSTRRGKGIASASARIRRVNLFGGLVTAAAVEVTATAKGARQRRSGVVTKLVVNGQSVGTVKRRRTLDMGGHGTLVVLGSDSGHGIIGLRATLTSDYNGFSAGSAQ